MISQVVQTIIARGFRLKYSAVQRAVPAVVAFAALLLLDVTMVKAAEQRPPFLTMEDQRRCIVQDDNCLRWIYQKALIGKIVQPVLIQRGFEQKTAFFIARDWDAFRYDIESGAKILPKPAMLLTAADAVGFANQIPQCLADISTSSCQIRFAAEYGCNLQRDYGPACRRDFEGVKAKFTQMPVDGAFMSWFNAEYKLYNAIACLYGPNGGDIPVFDAGPGATVTKLKFDAGADAAKFTVAALAQPAAAAANPPALTSAPACKAVIRASQWRANDEFRDGQELPEQLQAPGLHMGNVELVLRRKGDNPPLDDPAISLNTKGKPSIVYNDLPDGWLGMELGKIVDLRGSKAPLPRAIVTYVAPDGPAAQAGIQKGDYILRIGGRAVDDAMYLGLHMTEAPIGKPMSVVYQRNGLPTTVTLTAIDIEEAARKKDTSALRYLGDFYANQRFTTAPGSLSPPNYYLQAAELGDAGAMARLANKYSGNDKAEARKWYENAANAGHIPSMRRLADLYSSGEGGPKDLNRAREFLEKGAAAGDVEQMYEIVKLYRQEGESKIPDQRKWLEKIVALPKGTIPKDGGRTVDQATFDLGLIKLHGLGGPKDLVEGRALMEKAASSGSVSQAPYVLGMFLMTNDGGLDFAKGKMWLERGSKGENADSNAMWALGMVYKEGAGVPKNPAEAHKWLQKAADMGNAKAIADLGPKPPSPPPPQRPIVPPKPITPDMRIAAADVPGPATQGAKSAGKCNPDCAEMAIFGTKLVSITASNAKECRDSCLATNKCVGWTLAPQANNCELVQSIIQLVPWGGNIAGTVSRGK